MFVGFTNGDKNSSFVADLEAQPVAGSLLILNPDQIAWSLDSPKENHCGCPLVVNGPRGIADYNGEQIPWMEVMRLT